MMSRKHYNAIAKILRASFEGTQSDAETVAELCDLFQSDNPAFNPEKFCKAVGVEAGEL